MWTQQARDAANAAKRAKEMPAHQQGIQRATYGGGAAFLLKALLGAGLGAASFVKSVTRPGMGGRHGR